MLSRSMLIACTCSLGCWDFESLRLRALEPNQAIVPSKQTLRCDQTNYFTNRLELRTKNYDPAEPYLQSEDPDLCQIFDTSAQKVGDGLYNVRITCPPTVVRDPVSCTFIFGEKYIPQQFTLLSN